MPVYEASARTPGPFFVSNNRRESYSTQHTQDSDPFRTPRHSPANSFSSSQFQLVLSGSPAEERKQATVPRNPHPLSQSSGMTSQQRSVDVRRLDGRPYPGHEETNQKPRKVKVARDMYAGEMPPEYGSANVDRSETAKKTASTTPASNNTHCQHCGAHRQDGSTDSNAAGGGCKRCGKSSRSRVSPSSYPITVMGSIDSALAHGVRARPDNANPSTAPRVLCTKCGKHKRTVTAARNTSSLPQLQTSNHAFNVNVEPPTATRERAPSDAYATVMPRMPMPTVHPVAPSRPVENPRRGNSISSIFRSLSRKTRQSSDESNAMSPDQTSYQKLDPNAHAQADRPGSPFSFVDKPQEEEAFELDDMRKSKLLESRNSWEKTDEARISVVPDLVERPKYNRSQSTKTAVMPVTGDDTFLGVDQRPVMTRFKSLRSGVNRAASQLGRSASQISNSAGLRRLESVKKVPQFWYKDMELGGQMYNEGYVY